MPGAGPGGILILVILHLVAPWSLLGGLAGRRGRQLLGLRGALGEPFGMPGLKCGLPGCKGDALCWIQTQDPLPRAGNSLAVCFMGEAHVSEAQLTPFLAAAAVSPSRVGRAGVGCNATPRPPAMSRAAPTWPPWMGVPIRIPGGEY